MTTDAYRLEIRAEITKYQRSPDDPPHYFGYSTNERMAVNQTIDLGALDFLEMCKVLGALQDLAEEIRKKHAELQQPRPGYLRCRPLGQLAQITYPREQGFEEKTCTRKLYTGSSTPSPTWTPTTAPSFTNA